MVKKALHGDELSDLDMARNFLFKVELTDKDGKSPTGTKVYGDVVFVDGVAQFRLGNGDSTLMTDIPSEYKFTVTEVAEDGFKTQNSISESKEDGSEKTVISEAKESLVATGSIAENKTVTVDYTNTKNYTDSDDTSFTLRKVVQGNFQLDKEYEFFVHLEGLRSNQTYKMSNGATYKANSNGVAEVALELKNGEEITFEKIPLNSKYMVTETAGN